MGHAPTRAALQVIMVTHCLTLPHPRYTERDFVLYPLREISDTNLVLPDGSDIESLAAACASNNLVRTQSLSAVH